MLITRTPCRVSWLGGSLDHPSYFLEHGASVIGSAINKYSYITIQRNSPFLGYKTHLAYSEIEQVQSHDEIRHRVIREALKLLNIDFGISLTHSCDLPNKTGIGSSSTFAVCLIHSLAALSNRMLDKYELARLAIKLEREILGDTVGYQDQIWASFGGINEITFNKGSDQFTVNPLCLSNDFVKELEQSLLLVFTGTSRLSSSIAASYIPKITDKLDYYHQIKQIAVEGKVALLQQNIKEFGRLLDKSWKAKSKTGNISTDKVDDIYRVAIANEAYGGKLIGAGGGGFVLLVIDSARRQYFRELFKDLIVVDFCFDFTGSNILYYGGGSGVL